MCHTEGRLNDVSAHVPFVFLAEFTNDGKKATSAHLFDDDNKLLLFRHFPFAPCHHQATAFFIRTSNIRIFIHTHRQGRVVECARRVCVYERGRDREDGCGFDEVKIMYFVYISANITMHVLGRMMYVRVCW